MRQVRGFVRRNRWTLLLLLIALPVARWLTLRGKPELLGEASPFGLASPQAYQLYVLQTVYQGRIYALVPRPDQNLSVQSCPLTGNTRQELAPQSGLRGDVSPPFAQSSYLYFCVGKKASLRFPPWGDSLKKEGHQAKPVVVRYSQGPDWQEAALYRIPLTGGSPQALFHGLKNVNVVLAGDDLYWIRARPNEVTRTEFSPEKSEETARYHSDLMLTSLATGATRQLASGLPYNASLARSSSGVYWQREAPQNAPDLMRYDRAKDKMVVVLPHTWLAFPPCELEGSVYWVDHEMRTDPGSGQRIEARSALMRVNLDGSDRQKLLTLTENHVKRWDVSDFRVHRNHLYCLLQEKKPDHPDSSLQSLCVLRLDGQPRLEKIQRLPDTSPGYSPSYVLDEGYCYYIDRQMRESWADWQKPVETKYMIYRFRLPD